MPWLEKSGDSFSFLESFVPTENDIQNANSKNNTEYFHSTCHRNAPASLHLQVTLASIIREGIVPLNRLWSDWSNGLYLCRLRPPFRCRDSRSVRSPSVPFCASSREGVSLPRRSSHYRAPPRRIRSWGSGPLLRLSKMKIRRPRQEYLRGRLEKFAFVEWASEEHSFPKRETSMFHL